MQCLIAAPDLSARLHGTICMYDGIPYLVCTDGEDTNIELRDFMSKDRVKFIKASDPLFDIATPPLGYFHVTKDRVAYAERVPHRQFKQGLTPQVMNYQYFVTPQRVNMHSEGFYNMMVRNYPDLKDILEIIFKTKKYGEYALSNDCAIVRHESDVLKVYFRHEEVGFLMVSELKKRTPVVHVPASSKAWITCRYLSQLNWEIVQ